MGIVKKSNFRIDPVITVSKALQLITNIDIFFIHLKFETSNWGTETNPDFVYHNGNSEPRGFGRHIVFIFF